MSGDIPILIVGAGVIAETHAAAIAALPGLAIVAVVDPDARARARFTQRWAPPAAYASVEEAIKAGGFRAAHVLVPPDRHADIAGQLLAAKVPVLVEKPLAHSASAAAALVAATASSGARLGVNQNSLFHPAFAALRRRLAAGEIGPLRHLACVYHAPLRQLAARQFGNWMFRAPQNILLEQAAHPLAQLRALAGSVGQAHVLIDRIDEIGDGVPFIRSLTAAIAAEEAPANLRFAIGESFPVWRLEAFGTDGTLVADMIANRCYAIRRTRWLDAIDAPLSTAGTASAMVASAAGELFRYAGAQLRLSPRADPFFRSMRDSIAAFHSGARFESDAAFGAEIARICETLAGDVAAAPIKSRPPSTRSPDVVVIGGTGFIGAHLIDALVAKGHAPCVMARSIENLAPVFAHDALTIVKGDIRNRADVERAIGGARLVVNLAHGGGGSSYDDIRAGMFGGAEIVAEVCKERGVTRLVHVGSIASLYLGPDAGTVGADAVPDRLASRRGDYARVKAETDLRLLERHALQSLPVVILRPGLVVGAGASPFHSGLGAFNNEQHCIGWHAGANPLPFVLARDVASAIVGALTADGVEGRSYVVVGDVRPTARDYVSALAMATGRPLRFHPSNVYVLWSGDCLKWVIKRIGGNRAPLPSLRDLRSRGLSAPIDTTRTKTDLDWAPEADAARFYEAIFAPVRRLP